jgi:hypothetical protein
MYKQSNKLRSTLTEISKVISKILNNLRIQTKIKTIKNSLQKVIVNYSKVEALVIASSIVPTK